MTTGGTLIAALLAGAYGLALSHALLATVRRALATFLAAAAAAMLVAGAVGPLPALAGRAGLAVAVASAISALGLPGTLGRAPRCLHAAAALLAGAAAGALAAGSGALGWAAPAAVLTVLPGHWAATTGRVVAVRVVASWALAVTMLAVVLALAPITAGNALDHLE